MADIPWPVDGEPLSENAHCIIDGLLTVDPSRRMSAKGNDVDQIE